MRKVVIIVLIAVLAGGGVYAAIWLTKKDNQQNPAIPQHTEESTSSTTQSNSQSASVEVKSGEVEIMIEDFAFSPATLKVKKGTKVTWTNHDSVGHTVTSDTSSAQKGLNSATLGNNQSYSFTFDSLGTYSYHCTPHPNMQASVEVVE